MAKKDKEEVVEVELEAAETPQEQPELELEITDKPEKVEAEQSPEAPVAEDPAVKDSNDGTQPEGAFGVPLHDRT